MLENTHTHSSLSLVEVVFALAPLEVNPWILQQAPRSTRLTYQCGQKLLHGDLSPKNKAINFVIWFGKTGRPRLGSVTVWGWKGSSGSGFRFWRFLYKRGFSVLQYSLTGRFRFRFRFLDRRFRFHFGLREKNGSDSSAFRFRFGSWATLQKRGLLEKGSFQQGSFSRDSREFRDYRKILEWESDYRF